ncbi:glutamine amidotransferase [Actinotalea sp. K2]|uniref:glutamine amidotransferase n=1 Tax=Actinotalea sp. K2 TaxID=2939438 RepID=UPI0020176C9B|nr:glutamine amidotransferase [Actinotalea sp. K2]MCL3863305.1 glutamine amidotransferase [Actinotalea sp. K2]
MVGETWLTVTTVINGVDSFAARAEPHDSAEGFARALRAAGHVVDRLPSERVNADFPQDAGLLRNRHDVVVIGDVGSDSFLLHPGVYSARAPQRDRLQSLVDFVRSGGGLVMIGGYLSFSGYRGMAGYGRTALADVLPVIMGTGDDRVERPAGVAAEPATPDHPVLAGVTGPWPPLLGYNRVQAAEGSELIVTIADEPLLVLGTAGRGRTAAFTSDCAPHWATDEFLAWEHYGTLFANLVRWAGAGTTGSDRIRDQEGAA